MDGRHAHVGQRPRGERGFGQKERDPPSKRVGHHARGDLEQGHGGGERRVGHEHLEDRQPGVEQEQRVDAPDQRRGQREQPADDEDRALHEWVVTLEDGPQEQSPDAGQREDLLRHHRAAEQVADLDARHRDERDETVLECMAPQDAPFGQPLRARRADVVLSHHLEQ